ncbi:MAG: hypothetical protein Q8P73_04115 [bacterium]|nr:hypothetical protein [bacterium]
MSEQLKNKVGRPANCRNCHLSKSACVCGRPTKFNEETITKLQEVYLIGANHQQAAAYARVSLSTLHGWMKQNPNFRDLIDQWRQRPTLIAYKKVFESLSTDVNSAWRWLEKHDPELAPVRRHKHGGFNSPENKPVKFERIIVEVPASFEKK